jgi:hypothetical protein
MPVMRRGKDRTSFGRKIELHLDIWRAGLHTAQFGFKAMRVLTVTPSPQRVETMVQAVYDLTEGRGSGASRAPQQGEERRPRQVVCQCG